MAVDNEALSRLPVGVNLEGAEGFRANHRLLGSTVEDRRMDAFALFMPATSSSGAQIAGFSRVESVVVAEIDDHPRLMAQLVA